MPVADLLKTAVVEGGPCATCGHREAEHPLGEACEVAGCDCRACRCPQHALRAEYEAMKGALEREPAYRRGIATLVRLNDTVDGAVGDVRNEHGDFEAQMVRFSCELAQGKGPWSDA